MSVRVMAEVFERELKPLEAWVLMAFADHADHDGGNIFPSVKRIAWKTGVSVRKVQYVLRHFEELGVMVKVEEACRHRPAAYRIDIEKLPQKPPLRGAPDAPLPPLRGAPHAPLAESRGARRASPEAARGAHRAPPDGLGVHVYAPPIEPSVLREPSELREPSGASRRAKPRHALDPTAELSEAGHAKAVELGCKNPEEAWREFRSYWVGEGKLKANWNATWENHMRKCHVLGTFQCPCGRKAQKAKSGNPGAMEQWEDDHGYDMRRAG